MSLRPRTALCPTLRRLTLAFLATLGLVPALAGAAPSDWNDSGVYPKPPTPLLPAAGGVVTDPVFGTQILRITDPTVAPKEMDVNSKPQTSEWNADGTLFYIHQINGSEAWLFKVDPVAFTTRKIATLPKQTPDATALGYDGADWDPIDPSVLYNVSGRKLYKLVVDQTTDPATVTVTLLHDFTADLPRIDQSLCGTNPLTGAQLKSCGEAQLGTNVDRMSGRFVSHSASSCGVKDQYDYVSVFDRQLGTTVTLHATACVNDHPYSSVGDPTIAIPDATGMHSTTIDYEGHWIELAVVSSINPAVAGVYFWNWQTGALTRLSGCAEGHRATGPEVSLNPCGGPDFVIRDMATPDVFTPAFSAPRTTGQTNVTWQDNHASRAMPNGRVFVSQYIPAAQRPNVTLWLPLMEEIYEFQRVPFGTAAWRRLAHTRSVQLTNNDFDQIPRANVDPTKSFVLFRSNWDNTITIMNPDGTTSPRWDVFLLRVPKDTTPPTVSVTAPVSGSVVQVGSVVTITADATDDVGPVIRLNVVVDGKTLCSLVSQPWSCTWTVPTVGTHRIFSTATDVESNVGQSQPVTVTAQ